MDMRFRLQSSRHERVHETEGQAFHSSQGVGSLHLENEIADPRGGGVLPPRRVHAHLAHLSSLTLVNGGPGFRSSAVLAGLLGGLRFLVLRGKWWRFLRHTASTAQLAVRALKRTYFVYCR